MMPITASTTVVVTAHDPGHRAEASFAFSPRLSAGFEGCLGRVMGKALGGDERPAQIAFELLVVVKQ